METVKEGSLRTFRLNTGACEDWSCEDWSWWHRTNMIMLTIHKLLQISLILNISTILDFFSIKPAWLWWFDVIGFLWGCTFHTFKCDFSTFQFLSDFKYSISFLMTAILLPKEGIPVGLLDYCRLKDTITPLSNGNVRSKICGLCLYIYRNGMNKFNHENTSLWKYTLTQGLSDQSY